MTGFKRFMVQRPNTISWKQRVLNSSLCLLVVSFAWAQPPLRSYDSLAADVFRNSLRSGQAYEMLRELTSTIGHRISGSHQAAKAVTWAENRMKDLHFENVRLEEVSVPHWLRGDIEDAAIILPGAARVGLNMLSLGGSVPTPKDGITAEVIEVQSLGEVAKLGNRAKGRIIFFNRPFDPSKFDIFDAYAGAVDQRVGGAVAAARVGGVLAIVRSMAAGRNDVPHTGIMRYNDSIPKIPAIAISTLGADKLSDMLRTQPGVRVFVRTNPQTLPDVQSANVLAEFVGSQFPNEVVLIGGHLDSWDVGQGAHDDGAGVVQSIEAIRLLKQLGVRPRRTIRVVAFTSEENGIWGGRSYAAKNRPGERCIAAIESDRGAGLPQGFSTDADSTRFSKIVRWEHLFRPILADHIVRGEGGPDIFPLAKQGVPLFSLLSESSRYFNYHHTREDTFDTVNERELELGAACIAILSYVLAEEGL